MLATASQLALTLNYPWWIHMYPIHQLLPSHLNFSLLCSQDASTHTHKHNNTYGDTHRPSRTHTHTLVKEKKKKNRNKMNHLQCLFIWFGAFCLNPAPPTQTPWQSTGTSFGIKRSCRQTFFPPNLWVNELSSIGFSFKHTFNFLFDSLLGWVCKL